MPLEISLFGNPRLQRAGQRVHVRRRKGLALLAYLAITGQAHGRDSLVELFWPELDGASARANLRRELSRLRQELGAGVLQVDGDQIALDPAAVGRLDVAVFRDLLAQVRRHGHPPGRLCPTCAAALAEAAGLYAGDFMAGFGLPDAPAYDEWHFFEAEGLRQMLAEGLQQLAAWHAGRGEFQPAIDHARRWLALDPLHEPAHRELVRLYAWSGQAAAATRQYEEAVRILDAELGVTPELETTQLIEAVRGRRLPPPGPVMPAEPGPAFHYGAPRFAAPASNLPGFPTPFIGRAAELARLAEMLADPAVRLVNVTGVGGMGKTRLALAAAQAEQAADRFPHGVYFVALAPLGDGGQIAAAIAGALRLLTFAETPLEQQVVDFLRPTRLLLLLDNFEHLLTPRSAGFLGEILAAAPEVKLLVTSRVRLGLQSEQLFALDGLDVPAPLPDPAAGDDGGAARWRDVEGFSSIELFRQSARRLRPEFSLTDANLPAVLQICQHLQGMPLGIELAAAWVELLSPAEIAAELSRSLDFLDVESLGVPERQRSLRAVFDAAWRLLSPGEREAMKPLTVFQGSFTRAAAEAVGRGSLKELLGLANKSWLQRVSHDRYQIHPLLREYAAEALRAGDAGWQNAQQRHATHFAARLAALDRQMNGPQLQDAFAEVAADFADIHQAWHWLVGAAAFEPLVGQLLPAFFRFCEARSRSRELLPLLEDAIARLEEHGVGERERPLLAVLLTAVGAFEQSGVPMRFETFGMVTGGREGAIRRAWELFGSPDTQPQLGFWAVMLSYLYGHVVDRDQAISQVRRLITFYRAEGWSWELAFGLEMLAMLLTLGPLDEATDVETEACVVESLALFKQLVDEREAGYVLRLLGQLRRLEGRFREAIEHWDAAQARLEAIGDRLIAADIHWQMGDAYLQLGEHAAAFSCYRTMNAYHLGSGNTWLAGRYVSKEAYEAVRYGDLAYAREKRQQSLALARRAGDEHTEAWSTWEMAELERVAGDLPAARQWAERARILFAQGKIDFGFAFYYRLMGDIAHAEAQYREAAAHFEASERIARSFSNDWAAAYALSGLGRALAALGETERSRRTLAQALSAAEKTGEVGILQVARAATAEWHAALGDTERAAALSEAVIGHPAAWKETKARAAAVLERLGRPAAETAA